MLKKEQEEFLEKQFQRIREVQLSKGNDYAQ